MLIVHVHTIVLRYDRFCHGKKTLCANTAAINHFTLFRKYTHTHSCFCYVLSLISLTDQKESLSLVVLIYICYTSIRRKITSGDAHKLIWHMIWPTSLFVRMFVCLVIRITYDDIIVKSDCCLFLSYKTFKKFIDFFFSQNLNQC